MSIRKPAGHTSLCGARRAEHQFLLFDISNLPRQGRSARAPTAHGHTTGRGECMHAETEEKPRQVADEVAERIERLILDGVLKAGQALPSERRLTEKLGVSRTALREGLKLLRAREIIHTAQGKGSFVARISKVDAGPLM